MKKILLAVMVLLTVLSLSACAAGPNMVMVDETVVGEIAGFWQGLWHGFISPVTFIISLFNDNVSIYEVLNNGGWYNFGFMMGVSIIFGGGGNRSKRC